MPIINYYAICHSPEIIVIYIIDYRIDRDAFPWHPRVLDSNQELPFMINEHELNIILILSDHVKSYG